MARTDFTLEDAISYHLGQIRRYGLGWKHPSVRKHREMIIELIKLRRVVRKTARVPYFMVSQDGSQITIKYKEKS